MKTLTVYKTRKAYHGFTLFTPMLQVPSDTWLIDMQGRFVHHWQLPGQGRMHAELLPNGNLFFGLRDIDTPPPKGLPFTCDEIMEMDWDGDIAWTYKNAYMDAHGRARLENGNTLILNHVEVPKDIAVKVKGGIPGTEFNNAMWGYALQEITLDGKVVWEWLSYEHVDPELDSINPLRPRWFWPLFNSLVALPNGNIITCSPNTDNITIIDKATGDIKWRWGKGIISFPHNPSMLDNGNILLFDNGKYNTMPAHSRVIEVNPRTNKIEWEYKAENRASFFSDHISGCQRLPNGNTLICEGSKGRLFEVTAGGETVWEYIVPFYARSSQPSSPWIDQGLSNATFRAYRYGPDYPGLQGKKLDPEKLDLARMPSVRQPSKGNSVSSRAKLLGY